MDLQDIIKVVIILLIGASYFLLNRFFRRGSREKSSPVEWKESLSGEIKELPKWKPIEYIKTISLILTALLVVLFALMFLLGDGNEVPWGIVWLMLILIFPVAISWSLLLVKSLGGRYQRTWAKPLLDLAHEINMRIAVETGSRYWGHYYPSASGEYRGRPASLTIDGDYINTVPSVIPSRLTYLRMALPVENKAGFSLSIQLKGNLFGPSRGESGAEDFDKNFQVKGSPPEFISRVQKEIKAQSSLPVWKRANRISIELNGPVLSCKQYNYKVLDASNQVAVLNLLVRIAELAEEMQSQT